MSETFRRLSVTTQSTFTVADHGPVIGGLQKIPRHVWKKAEKELNENEERKKTELETLRKMFDTKLQESDEDQQNEVKMTIKLFQEASDDVLTKFLRARKFDPNRTWELMQNYAKYRIVYPEVVENIDENEIRKWVEKAQPGVFPSRDAQGRVIIFFSFENWNPEILPFTKAMKILIYVLEKLLENPETQINGVCIIEDFQGYTMSQMAAVSINEYKQMIDMLQGSFPCRFKGVYCIRQPWFFAKVFNMVKPYLKAKIFSRIHIYGEDLKDFYNEFPNNFLPSDLGGSAPPYDGKAVANMLFGKKENDIDEDTAL